MPNRDRITRFAIGGLIAISILLIGIAVYYGTLPNRPSIGEPLQIQAYDTGSAKDRAGCQPTDFAQVRNPVERQAQLDSCNRKAEHHRAEQQRLSEALSVQAGQQAVWQTYYQGRIGAMQSAIAAIVFFVTVWAAWAASKAARYAHDAVTISDKAMKANDRPHFIIDLEATTFGPISDRPRQDTIPFTWSIVNYGNSPGWIWHFSGWIQIAKAGEPPVWTDELIMPPTVWPIAPGSYFGVNRNAPKIGVTVALPGRKEIISGSAIAYFLGHVRYRDAHGEEYLTRYVYVYQPSQGTFAPYVSNLWHYN